MAAQPRYSILITHEVVCEDGTRLWDDEVAFHHATGESVVLVENGLADLAAKIKAAISDGLRHDIDRASPGGRP